MSVFGAWGFGPWWNLSEIESRLQKAKVALRDAAIDRLKSATTGEIENVLLEMEWLGEADLASAIQIRERSSRLLHRFRKCLNELLGG